MSKIFNYIKFGIVLLLLFIFGSASASTWETIVDLKQSISSLQEKQKAINIKNPDLSGIEDIRWFLKDELYHYQINDINKIISQYNSFKLSVNNLEKYSNEILIVKKETYKKLTPYVKSENLDEFLSYIKNNLETVKQDKSIKIEISKKQVKLEAKVDAIKEKIKENKDEFENNILDIINTKVEEKVNIIKDNNDFNKLDLEKKKYVIAQVIKKLEIKKSEKQNSWNKFKEREIYIYELVIWKLKLFLSELK